MILILTHQQIQPVGGIAIAIILFSTLGHHLITVEKTIDLKYMKNNEIKIIFNMKKRTLKFIINEEDNGDSYINIPIDKPLFPAICLYNQDDCVEISEY